MVESHLKLYFERFEDTSKLRFSLSYALLIKWVHIFHKSCRMIRFLWQMTWTYKSSLQLALYCWILALLSLPSFLRMQAIRYTVWSTLVLNATCWVLHSQFHTPFQYNIPTILICCPGENHDSLNYSLHFLVSEGGRMPHSTEHGKTSPTIARLMESSTVINGRWCHIRWCDRNAVRRP